MPHVQVHGALALEVNHHVFLSSRCSYSSGGESWCSAEWLNPTFSLNTSVLPLHRSSLCVIASACSPQKCPAWTICPGGTSRSFYSTAMDCVQEGGLRRAIFVDLWAYLGLYVEPFVSVLQLKTPRAAFHWGHCSTGLHTQPQRRAAIWSGGRKTWGSGEANSWTVCLSQRPVRELMDVGLALRQWLRDCLPGSQVTLTSVTFCVALRPWPSWNFSAQAQLSS